MDLAAPKATDDHGSDTYHTLINTLALTSCEPQSQLQKADCCSSAVTCGYKVDFFSLNQINDCKLPHAY